MQDAPHRIAEAEGNKAENSYASCGIVRSLARGRIGRDAGPLIFKQKLRLRKNLEHGPDIRISEHVRRRQTQSGAALDEKQGRPHSHQHAAEETVLFPDRARIAEIALHGRCGKGVAVHHHQVDRAHGDGQQQQLRQQGAAGADELRQHRHHENDSLGIGGVGHEAQQHALAHGRRRRLQGRLWLLQRGGVDLGAPLAQAEVDQVQRADRLDRREHGFGRQQDRADAGAGHKQDQQQTQLQASDGGRGFLDAVRQAMRHRQHRAGTGRNGDQPAGGEKGKPGMEVHDQKKRI